MDKILDNYYLEQNPKVNEVVNKIIDIELDLAEIDTKCKKIIEYQTTLDME